MYGAIITGIGGTGKGRIDRQRIFNLVNARNFYDRPPEEQEWLLENTWCDICNESDLGLTEPHEFEEDGEVILAGLCSRCGNQIRSILVCLDRNTSEGGKLENSGG